jgi:hypothetical protein
MSPLNGSPVPLCDVHTEIPPPDVVCAFQHRHGTTVPPSQDIWARGAIAYELIVHSSSARSLGDCNKLSTCAAGQEPYPRELQGMGEQYLSAASRASWPIGQWRMSWCTSSKSFHTRPRRRVVGRAGRSTGVFVSGEVTVRPPNVPELLVHSRRE